jgi:hypothetical protein
MSGRTGSFLIGVLAIATLPTPAQWLNYPTPGIPRTPEGKPNLTAPAPRTTDGKPDLSGIWAQNTSASGVRQLNPSEIKAWALELAKERQESLDRDSPSNQCLPAGPGPISGLDKIVQTPALILILHEDLTYRQIFLDGRELPKDPNPAWMGYSDGRWEGDTVLVQTGRDRAIMTECNGLFESKHCSRDGISMDESSSCVSAGTRVSN